MRAEANINVLMNADFQKAASNSMLEKQESLEICCRTVRRKELHLFLTGTSKERCASIQQHDASERKKGKKKKRSSVNLRLLSIFKIKLKLSLQNPGTLNTELARKAVS